MFAILLRIMHGVLRFVAYMFFVLVMVALFTFLLFIFPIRLVC